MNRKLDKVMNEIFYNVQFNKTCHQSHIKKLKKYYDQSGNEKFWESFISCFRVPLTFGQRHPRVENTLEFVAKFAVSFYSCTEDDASVESMCPFLINLFDFLVKNNCAKDAAVRFRICHFLNMLLNSMGEQAFLDDTLCHDLTVSLMDRLLDKSAKVRAQAIFALHRLQDPSNDHCPVIKMYIFHASKDPKAEVRRAALMSMGKNQRTLQVALRRTRDIDETVRKSAYEFISKVTVRSLTIKQRDQLLNDGLKDRADTVRKCVENVLLPAWLRHFNSEYINLLRALDAEIGTDASVLALNSLFKSSSLNALLEQVPLDKQTKLIPMSDLCSENVLYWKCVVKHFQREHHELDTVLPELSSFCGYISDFVKMMSSKQYEKWETHTHMFILLQLFEIATVYDLSDEVGRRKLNELICNTLLTTHCSEKVIECTVTHLEKVIPDVNTRLDTLANIISDIRLPLKEVTVTQITDEQQDRINIQRAEMKVQLLLLKEEEYQAIQERDYLKAENLKHEINALDEKIANLVEKPPVTINDDNREEKNDPETMVKCLSIICTMMQSVTMLTPTLRGLMQIALVSLDHPNDNVHILALKAVGICCVLDKELAKKHIMMLFLQFSLEEENQEIWIIALKAIFDLLMLYGLEYFDIVENTEENTSNDNKKSRSVKLYNMSGEVSSLSSTKQSEIEENNCNFIKILAGLLDNANQGLRTIATEGLCKLLLNRRISSSSLLSRLIILCYNPANDGDFYMRQCLSGFFDNFIIRVPEAQEMLEEAFLPTLRILCNAPEISPLQEIDPYDVSRFILSLTRHGIRKPGADNYCAHNNLAFAILAEVLDPDSQIDRETLIKSLKDLQVEIDDNTSKENLREAMNKVSEMVKDSDKRLVKYMEQFKKKLDAPNVAESVEDEETETDD